MIGTAPGRDQRWRKQLAVRAQYAQAAQMLTVEGRLRRVVGLTLEAEGCEAPLGARCLVDAACRNACAAMR